MGRETDQLRPTRAEVPVFSRKQSSTVLDRLSADDISDAVETLRERAHSAVDVVAPKVDAASRAMAPALESAWDALSPRVEHAREAVSPTVEAAFDAVAPRVEHAREAISPAVDWTWAAMAPVLSAASAAAAEAARHAAETADKKTGVQRKEAKQRAERAAAALRGEKRRRWPYVLAALGLGTAVGAAAGVMSRRLTAPLPSEAQSFADLTPPRHAASHSTGTQPLEGLAGEGGESGGSDGNVVDLATEERAPKSTGEGQQP